MRKVLWVHEHLSNDTNCEIKCRGYLVHSLPLQSVINISLLDDCVSFQGLTSVVGSKSDS